MGYKITPQDYEEAEKNANGDALEAEGEFLVALHGVSEKTPAGENKTVLEFKVLDGENIGKIKSEWLRFENYPDEIKHDDAKRKQHYAAINVIDKLAKALGIAVQDPVEDLIPQIGQRLVIVVKAAKNKDGSKTYYNTKEYKATSADIVVPTADESSDIPF